MITGIAHESRNALQRIQSCTEMLELEVENNQEAQRLVSRLQQAQDNLLRLFDEVANYAGRFSWRSPPVTWRRPVRSLGVVGESAPGTRRNPVGTTWKHRLGAFRRPLSDGAGIRNLLENSLAACVDPVVIEIECVAAHLQGAPALEIRIHDNGPGYLRRPSKAFLSPSSPPKRRGPALVWQLREGSLKPMAGKFRWEPRAPSADFFITLPKATT